MPANVASDGSGLRPSGKVAVLCATPDCGFELYVDPLDERLTTTGVKCSFCRGDERMACCGSDGGGRQILKAGEPCPGCGSTVDRWDYITETVVRPAFAA